MRTRGWRNIRKRVVRLGPPFRPVPHGIGDSDRFTTLHGHDSIRHAWPSHNDKDRRDIGLIRERFLCRSVADVCDRVRFHDEGSAK